MLKSMRNLGHVIIEDNLSTKEYDEFDEKLHRLSIEQLRELMLSAGIKYDQTESWEPDDFIYVLDEAYWDEFDQAFAKVSGKSFNEY